MKMMAKVLLQFPEGLKRYALRYKKELEAKGNIVIASGSACFGACDIAIEEAKALGIDKVVHFGHNKFVKHDLGVDVEYIPWREDITISSLSSAVSLFKELEITKIALTTTVQHSHQIKDMKEFLENNGIKALTSRGFWAREEGQILGCDVGAARIDEAEAILYVGSGYFHPFAFLGLEKRVFVLNPTTSKINEFGRSAPLHFTSNLFLEMIKTPLFLRPFGVPVVFTGTKYFDTTSASTILKST